jgi:hypothetical protein
MVERGLLTNDGSSRRPRAPSSPVGPAVIKAMQDADLRSLLYALRHDGYSFASLADGSVWVSKPGAEAFAISSESGSAAVSRAVAERAGATLVVEHPHELQIGPLVVLGVLVIVVAVLLVLSVWL